MFPGNHNSGAGASGSGGAMPSGMSWAGCHVPIEAPLSYETAPVTCMICTEQQIDCFMLSCRHYPICSECFSKWGNGKGCQRDDPITCPLCKLSVVEVQVVNRIVKKEVKNALQQ